MDERKTTGGHKTESKGNTASGNNSTSESKATDERKATGGHKTESGSNTASGSNTMNESKAMNESADATLPKTQRARNPRQKKGTRAHETREVSQQTQQAQLRRLREVINTERERHANALTQIIQINQRERNGRADTRHSKQPAQVQQTGTRIFFLKTQGKRNEHTCKTCIAHRTKFTTIKQANNINKESITKTQFTIQAIKPNSRGQAGKDFILNSIPPVYNVHY